jgi:AAA domain
MDITTQFAERAALGIVLDHPEDAPRVFARVPVEEFTGRSMLIAEAIHGLRTQMKPIDHHLLAAEMRRRGTIGRVSLAEIASLKSAYTTRELLDGYLDEIATAVRRRKSWGILRRGADRLENPGTDALEVMADARDHLQGLIDAAEADLDVHETPTLREFLAVEDEPYDWVIPGLIERGDRMILTGPEGVGKSEAFRMIGVCAAAGIHPFRPRLYTPQRVLFIDCENSSTQIRRAMARLVGSMRRLHEAHPEDNAFIESYPEGFDLQDPQDEARFVRLVANVQPALLMTGSLYRLHTADPSDEKAARAVTRVIDRCRSAANCAVIIEAHTGVAVGAEGARQVRPIGSSLWLRWPEFGYGLRPTKDFTFENRLCDWVPWRGDRDRRAWPRRVKADETGGPLPWIEATYSDHNAT